MSTLIRASIIVAGALLIGAPFGNTARAAAVTINFDDVADGTVIDTHYAGITFQNDLGPASIYARSGISPASSPNVVSPRQTGLAPFDNRAGDVRATFASPVQLVSIAANIVRLPEGLGTPVNTPHMTVRFNDSTPDLIVNFDFGLIGGQPDAGAITSWETLQFISNSNNISTVFLLGGIPGGSPSNFAQFDNLTYEADFQGTARGSSAFALVGGPGPGVLPVPEPESLLLVGTAVLLVLCGSRQRKRPWRRA